MHDIPNICQNTSTIRVKIDILSKHINSSKERYLLGQNITCEFSGQSPLTSHKIMRIRSRTLSWFWYYTYFDVLLSGTAILFDFKKQMFDLKIKYKMECEKLLARLVQGKKLNKNNNKQNKTTTTKKLHHTVRIASIREARTEFK